MNASLTARQMLLQSHHFSLPSDAAPLAEQLTSTQQMALAWATVTEVDSVMRLSPSPATGIGGGLPKGGQELRMGSRQDVAQICHPA